LAHPGEGVRGHDPATLKLLEAYGRQDRDKVVLFKRLKPGTSIVREYQSVRHIVTISASGFLWQARVKTASWPSRAKSRLTLECAAVLWSAQRGERGLQKESLVMAPQKVIRCAVYTRKSTEHHLDLEFNSLDAQRESCEAYIKSQLHEGWRLVPDCYDVGGISAGSLDCPDLQRLLSDIRARRVDNVLVYKVDRLTRSLTDYVKLLELFDAHGVSLVSSSRPSTPPTAWAA
jgi:hypothetical protein